MASPFNIFDPAAIFAFATAEAASYWINLGITFLLSSMITGILLIVFLQVTSRQTGAPIKATNAFLVVMLINVINFFGIMGIMLSVVSVIPFMGLMLPVLVWIVFLKLFFSEMSWMHIIIVGMIFFAMTIFIVPYITSFIASFIPI